MMTGGAMTGSIGVSVGFSAVERLGGILKTGAVDYPAILSRLVG